MKFNKPYASFSDRAIAFVIDCVVLVSTMPLLKIMIPWIEPSHSLIILSINYFLFCHARWGQSLGKKVLGISVVTLEEQLPLNASRAFLREVSRILIPFTLFVGFLTPIVHARRLALHDMLAKTCVIQLHGKKNSHIKWIALIGCSTLVFFAFAFYQILFTSLPMKWADSRLKQSGINVSETKGSLYEGFSIKKIQLNTPLGSLELSNLSFRLKPTQLLAKGPIVIEQISASNGVLNARNKNIFNSIIGRGSAQRNTATPESSSTNGESLSLLIKNIEINTLIYAFEDFQSSVKRVYISQLNAHLQESRVSLDRLYLDAGSYTLDFGFFELSPNRIHFERPTFFSIKTGYNGKVEKDINGNFQLNFEGTYLRSTSISAFDNRLRARITKNVASVSIQQLDPNIYLYPQIPVTQINLTSQGTPDSLLSGGEWVGTMHLGKQGVSVVKNRFRLTAGSQSLEGHVSVYNLFMALKDVQPIVYWNDSPDIEVMTEWYFSKNHLEVSQDEMDHVNSLYHYFYAGELPSSHGPDMRQPSSHQ